MPAIIIIRIDDEAHAAELRSVGAKDLAQGFLPDAFIHPSKVTLQYRTPEDEALAQSGSLSFKEYRSTWPE